MRYKDKVIHFTGMMMVVALSVTNMSFVPDLKVQA